MVKRIVGRRVVDVPRPAEAELLALCEKWLSGRHCTLWGSAFEIVSSKGRSEAAAWLAEQVAGVLATSLAQRTGKKTGLDTQR